MTLSFDFEYGNKKVLCELGTHLPGTTYAALPGRLVPTAKATGGIKELNELLLLKIGYKLKRRVGFRGDWNVTGKGWEEISLEIGEEFNPFEDEFTPL